MSGLGRVLAEEMRADGVRVGVLLPGAVDTPLWDAIPGGPDRGAHATARGRGPGRPAHGHAAPDAALEELTLMPAGGIL